MWNARKINVLFIDEQNSYCFKKNKLKKFTVDKTERIKYYEAKTFSSLVLVIFPFKILFIKKDI